MERKIHNRKSAVFQSPNGDSGKSTGHPLQGGLDIQGQNDHSGNETGILSKTPVTGMHGKGYYPRYRIVFSTVRSIYGLVYLYSGMDKLFSLEKFRGRLESVPLFQGTAPLIALGLPVIEIILSIILLFSMARYEWNALRISVGLMVVFTIYISIMMVSGMHHSQCGCSGLHESLNWAEHLIFNLVMTGMGVSALAIEKRTINH